MAFASPHPTLLRLAIFNAALLNESSWWVTRDKMWRSHLQPCTHTVWQTPIDSVRLVPLLNAGQFMTNSLSVLPTLSHHGAASDLPKLSTPTPGWGYMLMQSWWDWKIWGWPPHTSSGNHSLRYLAQISKASRILRSNFSRCWLCSSLWDSAGCLMWETEQPFYSGSMQRVFLGIVQHKSHRCLKNTFIRTLDMKRS